MQIKNLVVADSSRTEKTICLAVSPSLKQYGILGRARLFEVVQKVREINTNRKYNAPGHILKGKSYEDIELKKHPEYELDYIIAPPQMKKYMKYSTNIYNIYLKYFSPDDICVYSIMDIVAKHATANKYWVGIACLSEEMYKNQLWNHKPLTDFWRVGKGYAKKLEANGMQTMGDVARCSIYKERIINMKIDRFNVVELKDGNRATIIDVRGKNEYFAEVVNAYKQTVAKRNIIDEEIK